MNSKYTYIVLLIFASLFSCVSCKEEEKPLDNPEIKISGQLELFSYKEETQELHFTSALSWTAASSESWCTVSPKSGPEGDAVISVHVDENPENKIRVAVLTLESHGYTKEIKISQKKREDPRVELEKEPEVFTSEGGTQVLKLNSIHEWTAKTDQPWCTVSPAEGPSGESEITITTQANDLPDERTAKLTFSSEGKDTDFTIYQKQKDALLLTSERAEVGVDGGQVIVTVQSNVDFDYRIADDASSWIHFVETKSLVSSSLEFSVDANSSIEKREGVITFVYSGGEEVFTVYQDNADPDLVLSKSEVTLNSRAQRLAIELRSNTTFSVCPLDVDWIKPVDPASTQQMTTYTRYFDVEENLTGSERETSIGFEYFTDIEKTQIAKAYVKVTQSPEQEPRIDIIKEPEHFSSDGGVQSVEFESVYEWTASCSADWCHLSAESGLWGTNTLEVTVDPNPELTTRNVRVLLHSGSITVGFDVFQRQKEVLFLPYTDLELPYDSGSYTFKFESNIYGLSHTFVSSWGDWISWRDDYSDDPSVIAFHVGENWQGQLRSGIISFTANNEERGSINVYQQAAYLKLILSGQDLHFDSDRTVFSVTLSHSLECEVSPSVSWIREIPAPQPTGEEFVSPYSPIIRYFEVDENHTGLDRDGDLVFSYTNENNQSRTETVMVHQVGMIYNYVLSLKFYYINLLMPEFSFLENIPHDAKFYYDGQEYPYEEGTSFKQKETSLKKYVFNVTNAPSFKLNDLSGIYYVDLTGKAE